MAMAAPSLSIRHSNFHHYSFAIASPASPSSSSSSHASPPPLRLLVRSSKAEGPLRRPSAPTKEASSPSSTIPAPLPPSPLPPPPAPPVGSAAAPTGSGVTIEYQRQRAKELQEYFLDRKYEEQSKRGRIFGWVPKNEISNGRWAMFGFSVGLLTEYATGSDFVEQLKIIVSNLGIAEID